MYLKGLGLGSSTIIGKIQKIEKNNSIIRQGRIIVSEELTYNLYKKGEKIKGIITDYGNTSSHAAILAKQSNLPVIIGAYTKNGKRATDVLQNDDIVKLDLKEGTVCRLTEEELCNMLQEESIIKRR
ncbi:PEP-utilizing enzyme [Sporohalobacter salinus]|uniref:PEP-utilizing enzyme n=1 Tax=Sporohalobacter salinus TaxID=1494606 RepID=UPI00195FFF5A|nr:PEP-utilizing enzyme [Sporohalobacter salinus]MBM7624672.1 phosphohistidine swiveling domain-containing protein [Sporohalobacter salinus]